jgi:hypothetical protein
MNCNYIINLNSSYWKKNLFPTRAFLILEAAFLGFTPTHRARGRTARAVTVGVGVVLAPLDFFQELRVVFEHLYNKMRREIVMQGRVKLIERVRQIDALRKRDTFGKQSGKYHAAGDALELLDAFEVEFARAD